MSLRFIFFGTSSDYSLIPLQRLASEHQLAALVESGEQESSCGELSLAARLREMAYGLSRQPSLWWYARQNRLPYFRMCSGNEDELAAFLRPFQADIGIVASFNQLFPAQIFQIPRLGMINFHPALLPKFRGPNVWFWEYYEMEKQGGATIHFIDDKEDSGDVINQASFAIPPGMPPRDLQLTTIELGAQLLSAAMEKIETGQVNPTVQRQLPCPRRARYLKPGEDLFSWQDWTLERTTHFLAGVYPWYRAFTYAHGWLGRLPWRATGLEKCYPSTPGKVRLDWRGVYFAHPQGKVRLTTAIPRERIFLWLGLAVAVAMAMIFRWGSTS